MNSTVNPTTILSIHYLPCIAWFRHLLHDPEVVLDQHEHFLKQSYRNRCMILSANGTLPLTIPVKKGVAKQPVHAIGIENDFAWQKQHWEAIRSAYNSSPFFEHYEPHFSRFYHTRQVWLQEFNLELISLCLKLLKAEKKPVLSTHYLVAGAGDTDLRLSLHPKKELHEAFSPYLQVFAEKFPFAPNLSIVDLLFNMGPAALDYLYGL
jgi:hypothetical protein